MSAACRFRALRLRPLLLHLLLALLDHLLLALLRLLLHLHLLLALLHQGSRSGLRSRRSDGRLGRAEACRRWHTRKRPVPRRLALRHGTC